MRTRTGFFAVTVAAPRPGEPVAFAVETIEQITGARFWLNRGAVHQIRERQEYNCRRAQRELGLRFTPLETSVRDAVAWYAHNGSMRVVYSAMPTLVDRSLPWQPGRFSRRSGLDCVRGRTNIPWMP